MNGKTSYKLETHTKNTENTDEWIYDSIWKEKKIFQYKSFQEEAHKPVWK